MISTHSLPLKDSLRQTKYISLTRDGTYAVQGLHTRKQAAGTPKSGGL